MSRIKEAFKDGKALIGFLTAGVPSAEDTLRYMGDLETAGADLIEIGVPFRIRLLMALSLWKPMYRH